MSKTLDGLVERDLRVKGYEDISGQDFDEGRRYMVILENGFIWSGYDSQTKTFSTVKEVLNFLYRIKQK